MAAIVQFIHPGPEHGPDGKYQSVKSWNDRPHKRKFLLSTGEYTKNDTTQKGELVFWGEWEPQLAYPLGKSSYIRQRLYWGISWEEKDKFDGMYSFSPVKIYNNVDLKKSIFSPVIIRDKNYISDNLTQGINSQGSKTSFNIETVKKLWESIRDQCRQAGCVEAVKLDIPKVKEKV